jgi:hypothetical protein
MKTRILALMKSAGLQNDKVLLKIVTSGAPSIAVLRQIEARLLADTGGAAPGGAQSAPPVAPAVAVVAVADRPTGEATAAPRACSTLDEELRALREPQPPPAFAIASLDEELRELRARYRYAL